MFIEEILLKILKSFFLHSFIVSHDFPHFLFEDELLCYAHDFQFSKYFLLLKSTIFG